VKFQDKTLNIQKTLRTVGTFQVTMVPHATNLPSELAEEQKWERMSVWSMLLRLGRKFPRQGPLTQRFKSYYVQGMCARSRQREC
jgi:hypothetical protein